MSRKNKNTSTLTDEDRERLIEAIHQRPTIWDRRDERYGNHGARSQCWTEVVEAMNDNAEGKHFPEELLRKCWTYLKDRFVRARREKGLTKRATSTEQNNVPGGDFVEGAEDRIFLQGKFFDQLSFLADANKIPTGMENEQRYYELSGNGGCRASSVPYKKQMSFGLGGGDEEMIGYNNDIEDSLANETYHPSSSSKNQRYQYQPSEFIPTAAKRGRTYLAFSPPTPNDFPATSRADNNEFGALLQLTSMAAKYTEFEPFAQNVNNVHKMLVEGSQRKMALELKRRINQLADEFEAKFYEAVEGEDHE